MNTKLFLIGVDEAGRGPMAGPVSAAALVIEASRIPKGVTDSKKLSSAKRELFYSEIVSNAVAQQTTLIHSDIIDKINILQATKQAMRESARAVMELVKIRHPDVEAKFYVLVDGNQVFCNDLPQDPIIKGDGIIRIIGAASILAKVTRDRFMKLQAEKFPEYGFEIHKGYPTKLHKERVREFGPCAIHRKSFAGVKEHLIEAAASSKY